MRRDPQATVRSQKSIDFDGLRKHFDRPEVAAVYVFGSVVDGAPHPLSDIDLAYLGVSGEAEDSAFDELYELLQGQLGEGRFDLIPLHRAPLHLQFAVATTGVPLHVKNPMIAEEFGTRAITRFLDFKPCRDQYFGTGG